MILSSLPLIISCDWIPPAFGAVGQYEMVRAREAAAAGRRVTLIGLGKSASDETAPFGEGEVRIVRIAAGAPDKGNLLKRAAWALRMNARLMAATKDAADRYGACEIKITGSPPFFSYLVLLWRQLFWRGKAGVISVTYRITDFYPETAFAAGQTGVLAPFAPLIHALRRSADRIEALSECQKRRLVESGVGAGRITVVRDASPVIFYPDTRPARRPFERDAVILLYSGNLGVAHDWRTFADGYRRHVQEGANRVRLWLNAGGVGAPALKAYCEANGLPVHVSPPVALAELEGVLLAADAHLILLGDPFWGYVFPSKTYACLDSGRPCLYVGPEQSDVHALLAPGHISLRQGDAEGVFKALERISGNRTGLLSQNRGETSPPAPPLKGS
jgi:hypothetical protein